jgi:hypothetical protein
MAIASTFEAVACFFLAKKQGYISESELEQIKREGAIEPSELSL